MPSTIPVPIFIICISKPLTICYLDLFFSMIELRILWEYLQVQGLPTEFVVAIKLQ